MSDDTKRFERTRENSSIYLWIDVMENLYMYIMNKLFDLITALHSNCIINDSIQVYLWRHYCLCFFLSWVLTDCNAIQVLHFGKILLPTEEEAATSQQWCLSSQWWSFVKCNLKAARRLNDLWCPIAVYIRDSFVFKTSDGKHLHTLKSWSSVQVWRCWRCCLACPVVSAS